MGKKALKKGEKYVFKHKKRGNIKIFLFEKQWLMKKFKKKLKNILVVWKNVVPLHPQSREMAAEWKDSDSLKIWNNKNVV